MVESLVTFFLISVYFLIGIFLIIVSIVLFTKHHESLVWKSKCIKNLIYCILSNSKRLNFKLDLITFLIIGLVGILSLWFCIGDTSTLFIRSFSSKSSSASKPKSWIVWPSCCFLSHLTRSFHCTLPILMFYPGTILILGRIEKESEFLADFSADSNFPILFFFFINSSSYPSSSSYSSFSSKSSYANGSVSQISFSDSLCESYIELLICAWLSSKKLLIRFSSWFSSVSVFFESQSVFWDFD